MKLTAQDVSDGKVSLARKDGAKMFANGSGCDQFRTKDGLIVVSRQVANRLLKGGLYIEVEPSPEIKKAGDRMAYIADLERRKAGMEANIPRLNLCILDSAQSLAEAQGRMATLVKIEESGALTPEEFEALGKKECQEEIEYFSDDLDGGKRALKATQKELKVVIASLKSEGITNG